MCVSYRQFAEGAPKQIYLLFYISISIQTQRHTYIETEKKNPSNLRIKLHDPHNDLRPPALNSTTILFTFATL